jgi:DNA repair protein RecO (recombination protein O)
MLHKTRGVVFHVTDYSETSVVAKIYTEVFGLQSYLVKGARRKKSKMHAGILQPMSLLEMEVYHKDHGGLQYAAEMTNHPVFSNIPYDMMKSSILLFINEIVYKSIREEEANPVLFDFLHHSMRWLDAMQPVNPDFHLVFMVQLTRYLGFFPNGTWSEQRPYFDLMEGSFYNTAAPTTGINTPPFMDPVLAKWLGVLLATPLQQQEKINIPKEIKPLLTGKLLEYYSLHVAGFGSVKSQAVLEAVWS